MTTEVNDIHSRLNPTAVARVVAPRSVTGLATAVRRVDACYPRFAEFLRLKRVHDPDDRLQSDWYRHYQRLYGLA